MDRILFVKTSSLGDVVHLMPAIVDARRHRPDARLVWVVEEAFAPLARLHPAVDQVIEVATRRWRSQLHRRATWRDVRNSLKNIRASEYDAVVDAQGLIRSAIITRAARGLRHGYDARSIREPLASRFYDVHHTVAQGQHPIVRNRALAALSLGYDADGDIDYGLDRSSLRPENAKPYAMLLHATADRRKEWSEENWIALGRELATRGHDVVLTWGTALERERSERIAAAVPRASVFDRRPLDVVAGQIAGADFVVGVDTGLLHVAAALGVPRVEVIGAVKLMPVLPLGKGPMMTVGSKGEPPSVEAVVAAFAAMWDQAKTGPDAGS